MKTAQQLIDEADSNFRFSILPKAEKRMIEKIAWGEGVVCSENIEKENK